MPNTFHFTEDSYEQSIISLFKGMGYEYHYGPELEAETGRELTDATIPGVLRGQLMVMTDFISYCHDNEKLLINTINIFLTNFEECEILTENFENVSFRYSVSSYR